MDSTKYFELVKKLPKPTELQINNFIKILSIVPDWYIQLSEERSHDFVIYIDPFGGMRLEGYSYNPIVVKESDNEVKAYSSQDHIGFWNYYQGSEPGRFDPISRELAEKYTIKLSRYFQEFYSEDSQADGWGGDSDNCAQKHEEIIKDIKKHMSAIVEDIYG